MEQFADYGHAIVALAALALFGLVGGPLSALAKLPKGLAAGSEPQQDYDDRAYRMHRAYANLTEVMGFFTAATVAAILAGASPTWVNWLASIFLVARLAHSIVHVTGIGPMNFGPRTIVFSIATTCAAIMAVLAILAAL